MKRLKVMMVDDEEPFMEAASKLLLRRGFETILAENGAAALEKLDENPDVILLDIKLNGMDGHRALREIKERLPAVPVIVLTGNGDIVSARRAREEGAFDYLSKPCDIDVLTGKINDAGLVGGTWSIDPETGIRELMIPIGDYTKLPGNATVREAVLALKKTFESAGSRTIVTGHRSVLVVDDQQRVIGIVDITDLLRMIKPPYLSAPTPAMVESIEYSPMYWKGMFLREVRRKADMKIVEVMSPAAYTINIGASLMEAAYLMLTYKVRRLVVEDQGTPMGVIREQDLFFEMEKIIGN